MIDPMDMLTSKLQLRTSRCGDVNVWILGDYQQLTNKAVFLTVHDFGSNAQSFDKFINHESMTEVRSRSVWINFEIPGQGESAHDLPLDTKFPSLQEIGEDLVEILNQLHIQYCVGFGEGAGANILTRFAITYPTRVLGLILIHPTATSAGWSEWVKDKLLSWKLRNVGVDPNAEDYLVMYKFGSQTDKGDMENREDLIQQYLADIRKKVNPRNLQLYLDSFLNRSDLSGVLRDKLTCDCLLMCGTKSSFLHTVETMHASLSPQKSTLLKIDNIGDPLSEAPGQVTRSVLLFCKGLGLLTSVSTPADRARSSISQSSTEGVRSGRRMSMQEADVPRRVSLSKS